MTRHISKTVGNIHTMPRSLLILALLVALVAWVATGSGAAEAVPPNFGDVIESKLTASDGEAGDRFGISVAISGDTAVVGAFQDDGNRGSAYVFVRPGGGWPGALNEDAKLTASDGAAGDRFGDSVAISGDTAVVGASSDDGNRGSTYVYEAQPTHRQLKASLDAIEAKLDGLDLDDLDKLDLDDLDKEVSQIERKVLEDALVRGDLYPLLATPVTVDSQGKLEEVLAVVGKSIDNFNAMGLATEDAQEEFEECEDLVASGKFVQAVEHCSEAMRELMEDNASRRKIK